MQQTVTVVALAPFDYEGKAFRRGEAVTMRPIDAAVHARLQHVSLDPRMKPTYVTREMVAAEPVTVAAVIPEALIEQPKRRRGRRRKASE